MIDAYSYCPGGTGKKIKHCECRDIFGELEKIIRAVEGNQRVAALDRINRTLATKANRPCLLALKIRTLLDMKDLQALEDTVTTFVKVAPDNVLARTFSGLLETRKRRLREAVDEFQVALSLLHDSFFPGELYDALDEVAHGLAESGEYLAARAHMTLRVSVDSEDEEARQSYVLLLHSNYVPQILKRSLKFEPCPAGVTWKSRFDAARSEVLRWELRKGLERFEKLNQDFPQQPAILHNLALARSCLALPQQPAAWRAYARCPGVPYDAAVEAEALAFILSRELDDPQVTFVKLTINVRDAQALNEQLLASRWLVAVPEERQQFRAADDGPLPKSVFRLLDKPVAESGAELSADTLSSILSYLMLYGRETDREARVELHVPKTEVLEQVRARLGEIAGDLLTGEEAVEEVDSVPHMPLVLNPKCHFPPDTPLPVRRRILNEMVQRELLRRWPNLPLAALDGKTSRQAMEDPAYHIPVAGVLLALEQLADAQSLPLDVNALRTELGVSIPEPIDPQTVDVQSISPANFARVAADRLGDDELLRLYEQASVFNARRAIVHLSEEILRREGLAGRVDRERLYGGMAEVASDLETAIGYLHKAQDAAIAQKQSPARYLLNELPLQIVSGNAGRANELIDRLQSRYLSEPGISDGLYSILVRFGIITPDGQLRVAPTPEAAESPAASSSRLWTPGAPPDAGDEKEPSQLWVPD